MSTASEKPHSVACIGSSELVCVSIAIWPTSMARTIQAFSRARSRTISYLLRSNGSAFSFARRASASEIGV